MSQGVVVVKVPDPQWGFPQVGRIIPSRDSSWGMLAELVGTPWEPLFPSVTWEIFDQALRGYATPLMRSLGPPPSALVRRLPVLNGMCRQRLTCVTASDKCVPGPVVPDCWESPDFVTPMTSVLNSVVRLWRDKIPVIRIVDAPLLKTAPEIL